ncbi:MAG: hypothetical protein MUF87_04410 [Anaerolineae bacterium]|jgi:hypothetical protein|nr:hypothetical protein [Anaerolineae bacterium]
MNSKRQMILRVLFVALTTFLLVSATTAQRKPAQEEVTIKQIAFNEDEGWAVLHGGNGYTTNDVPRAFNDQLREINEEREEIFFVAFAPEGGWLISAENGMFWDDLSRDVEDQLEELIDDDETIHGVAFAPDGGVVILYDDNKFWADGISGDLEDVLEAASEEEDIIKEVIFGADEDTWVVLKGFNAANWNGDIPEAFIEELREQNGDSVEFFRVTLALDGRGWALFSGEGIAFDRLPSELEDTIEELQG